MKHLYVGWVPVFISIAVLCGCGASPGPDVGALSPPENAVALPGVPGDPHIAPYEILARRASVLENIELRGDEFFLQAGGSSTDPVEHTLSLTPDPHGASYAIYRFEGLVYADAPSSFDIEFALGDPLPAKYYLALPNYAAGVWDWLEVEVPQGFETIELDETTSIISPGGNAYIAVIAWGGEPATISRVMLHLDLLAAPILDVAPVAELAPYDVVRVIDGDTARFWDPAVEDDVSVRFFAADTAELSDGDPLAFQAAWYTAETLQNAAAIYLELDPVALVDGFDRWLRWIWYEDGFGKLHLLNLELMAKGLAEFYPGTQSHYYDDEIDAITGN